MSFYELLTVLHVAAAIIWLGAGFLVVLLVLGAERAGDVEKEAGHHRDVAWLAPRLFIPASLSVLVLGLLLVIDGPWSFDQLWIVIALVGWTISFLLGILYFKPEGEQIGLLVQERGPNDEEARRRIHRLNVIDRVQVLILFVVVVDMVLKPVGGDTAVLVGGAVAILAATLMAAGSIRGLSSPATTATSAADA